MIVINRRYIIDMICRHQFYLFMKQFHKSMTCCCVYSTVSAVACLLTFNLLNFELFITEFHQ